MKYQLDRLPKELSRKDKRKEYAHSVAQEIRAGVSAREGLAKRWKTNEDNYRNINDSAYELVPGAVPMHIPLVQPMLDRINGTVYQSIIGVDPWVQVIPEMDDAGIGDAVERDLQFLMNRARFPKRLWSALKITSCTNCGLLRLRYENTVGFVIDVVHPNDFMVYPSSATSLDLSKSCGHRFYRTVSQIKAMQKSGAWIDTYEQDLTQLSTTDPMKDDSGRSQEYTKVTNNELGPDDASVELWEIVRREDFGEAGPMWYKCIIALDSEVLLDCAPFGVHMPMLDGSQQFIPYSGPDYFDFRYDDEYGIFWPSGSPAQNLQGVQNALNDAFNIWYWGNVASAFPAVVISGGSLGKKLEKLVPGAIIENESQVQAQIVGVTFNGSAFPEVVDRLQMAAEGAVRINRMAIGQELKSHTTATAAAGQMEMQRQSEDQYTAYISLGLVNFYTRAYELYRLHHQDILNSFGPSIEVKDPMALESLRFNFEPNGAHSTNNPQALVQKLQMLLAMSAQPGTSLAYPMVEQAVVRALQLPFSVAKITIPPEVAAQQLMGAAQGQPMGEDVQGALGQMNPQQMQGILAQLGGMG